MEWSCPAELPLNNEKEVAEREATRSVCAAGTVLLPRCLPLLLGRGDLKDTGSAAGIIQERGSEQGLDKFVNQKVFDKNGLLTDLVIVQKETEIGKISRDMMGHDSGKLNIGFGERRN